MKKEHDVCKDCVEYGSHFCPECLDDMQHLEHRKHHIATMTSTTVDLSTDCQCITTLLDTTTFSTQVAFTTHGATIWSTSVLSAAPISLLSHNITVDKVTLNVGLQVAMMWNGTPMPMICVTGYITDNGSVCYLSSKQVF